MYKHIGNFSFIHLYNKVKNGFTDTLVSLALILTEIGTLISTNLAGFINVVNSQALQDGYRQQITNNMVVHHYAHFNYNFNQTYIPTAVGTATVVAEDMQVKMNVPAPGDFAQINVVWAFYGGVNKLTDMKWMCALSNEAVVISTVGMSTVHQNVMILNDVTGGDFLDIGYHGRSHIMKLTLNVAASGPEIASITLNGIVHLINLNFATSDINFNAYQISTNSFAPWLLDQVDNTVFFTYALDGDQTGTFSFVSDGVATGTFTTEATGVTKTHEYIAKANWLSNTSLDTSLPTEYIVRYYYNGSFPFQVFVKQGFQMELIYEGIMVSPIIPNMAFEAQHINAGGASSTMSVHNMSVSFENGVEYLGQGIFHDTTPITITSGVPFPFASFRIAFQNNGYRNYISAIANFVNFISEGTKEVEITLTAPISLGNNTILDYPDYRSFTGGIPTSPSLITDPTKLLTAIPNTFATQFLFLLSKNENFTKTFTKFETVAPPGSTLLFLSSTSGANDLTLVFAGIESI